MKKDKDELDQENEEKELLLELIRMQNESLKRIFKNTIDKEKENNSQP
ncbi:hypothetical protein ABES02_25005 [Neobacillus pocheonensis]